MNVHEIKSWPREFQAMIDGHKTHEYRINDRDYRLGDVLHIYLHEPKKGFTSRVFMQYRVTDITYGPIFGVPDGHVVMSVKRIQE